MRYKCKLPHTLIAVDPATSGGAGIAIFEVTEKGIMLRFAETITGSWITVSRAINAHRIAETQPVYVVAEKPEHYKLDFKVARSLAQLEKVLEQVKPNRSWYPNEWKGNVPKSIHHARIRALVCLPDWTLKLDHNAMDAIGIGLFALGRIERGATKNGRGANKRDGPHAR